MKFTIENNGVTNPTLVCLLEWAQLIQEHITDQDNLFHNMQEVGAQLEFYRIKHQPEKIEDKRRVTVQLYSETEILISDQTRGEYIRLTNIA
jgi:hypothetical protein